MKAILEFKLPEEMYEYNKANKAGDYFTALDDMYNHLRSKVKYGELTEAEDKVYNEVYDTFFEILKENKVDLFE